MQYGDYKIVRYTPDYKVSLLDLLSLLWGSDTNSNLAYFRWKYDQNPYSDRIWIYLALYNGMPVGVRGNLAMRWQIGDPVAYINCLCDGDAVVLPEHRRKGLLHALTQLNLKDLGGTSFHYIVTLSANANSAANNLKLGWQGLGTIEPFVRIRPISVVAKGNLRSFASKIPLARKAYTKLRSVFRRLAPSDSNRPNTKNNFDTLDSHKSQLKVSYPYISIEDAPRPREMAELISRLMGDGLMRHVRDSEYFSWRYLNPRSSYRFLFWGEQSLDGYLILQTPARDGMHPVTIVDWEACNTVVRAELLKAAIEYGDFDVLKTWRVSLPGQTVDLLLQSGFIEETRKLHQENYQQEILLRSVERNPQRADWEVGERNLLDLCYWDIRPIYSDTY